VGIEELKIRIESFSELEKNWDGIVLQKMQYIVIKPYGKK